MSLFIGRCLPSRRLTDTNTAQSDVTVNMAGFYFCLCGVFFVVVVFCVFVCVGFSLNFFFCVGIFVMGFTLYLMVKNTSGLRVCNYVS